MPQYRHTYTKEVVKVKKDSAKDKELAADENWDRTGDKDDD